MPMRLGAVQDFEPKEENRPTRGRKETTETSGTEKKRMLQLEARMREREANDTHLKSPAGRPVPKKMPAATSDFGEQTR
eukprot:8308887-Pyramimonas_sp.AAC.1